MNPASFWQPRSLVWRLTFTYLATFLAFLGLAILALYLSIRTVIDYRMDADLIEDIDEFRLVLSRDGVTGVLDDMLAETASGEHESVLIQLLDSRAEIVHSTPLDHWRGFVPDQAMVLAATGNPQLFTEDLPDQDAETRFAIARLDQDHVFLIGESLEERDELMEVLTLAFALIFLPAMILAAALSRLLVRRAVQGIRRVSDAALAIHRGQLDRRVLAVGEVEEVQQLADTFDAMASRVEKLVGDMRDMTDNIAHDLRSPLTRVRILAESALQDNDLTSQGADAAIAIISECDRLRNLINLSLDVSEAEAGISRREADEIQMNTLLSDLVELYEPLAEERKQHLLCQIDDDLGTLDGDRAALQRMLGNLIDNAIKYAHAQSSIEVTAQSNGEHIVVAVSNTGDGIDTASMPRIFDRYFRADPSRSGSGSGLGLSYSRAVARLHGGDITVSSDPGGFTRFRIELPRRVTLARFPNSLQSEAGAVRVH